MRPFLPGRSRRDREIAAFVRIAKFTDLNEAEAISHQAYMALSHAVEVEGVQRSQAVNRAARLVTDRCGGQYMSWLVVCGREWRILTREAVANL